MNESSLAGVAKKTALAHAPKEDVGETVVIIIADGNSHSIELDVEACAARHVGKRAVAVVAVEPQSGSLAFARTERSECVPGPVHAVHKKDVLPAVVVVVEERAARPKRLREQLAAISAAIVLKVNPRRIRNIGQTESKRCGWILEGPPRHACRTKPCTQRREKKIAPLQGKFTKPFRIA